MKILVTLALLIGLSFSAVSQTTITLQPDASEGKDASVYSCVPCGFSTNNYGSNQDFAAIEWTNSGAESDVRSLIDFDLSSIPFGSTIIDARLSLYWNPISVNIGHSNLSGPNTTLIQRITSEWDEFVVTWNTQPSTTSVGEVIIPATTSDTQDNPDIDVTTLIQDIVDMPEEGFGMMIKAQIAEHYRSQLYCSSDHPDASKHPKLEVTYLAPGGAGEGNCLRFDGVDDYVDIGPAAGNQIRTIEMWFEPGSAIDNTLDTPTPLLLRNNSFEEGEFGLYFESVGSSDDAGKLIFFRNVGGASYSIASNSDSWNAAEWYHVAAVIDPAEGMKLFINGVLQGETDASVAPTSISSDILTIGTWGDILTRYFEGRIDDLHLSGDALYDSNFAVPCPDHPLLGSSVGLWLFNGTGSTALDEGGYGYDGNIIGAERETADICHGQVNGYEESVMPDFQLYPNPTTGMVNLAFEDFAERTIELTDVLGKSIFSFISSNKEIQLPTEGLPKGTYVLRVDNGMESKTKKVIKI